MAGPSTRRDAPRPRRLAGAIDERHLQLAEAEFPGIGAFYRGLRTQDAPRTFLELLVRFGAFRATPQ